MTQKMDEKVKKRPYEKPQLVSLSIVSEEAFFQPCKTASRGKHGIPYCAAPPCKFAPGGS